MTPIYTNNTHNINTSIKNIIIYLYSKSRNIGYKPRENTRKNGNMKHLNIINFTAISEELTGNKDAIRLNRMPRKYKESFNDLDELIEAWIKCTIRRTDNQQKK